jgi:hypothetical protein
MATRGMAQLCHRTKTGFGRGVADDRRRKRITRLKKLMDIWIWSAHRFCGRESRAKTKGSTPGSIAGTRRLMTQAPA